VLDFELGAGERALEQLARDHRLLLTVEDGTEVNGFGALVAATVQSLDPELPVAVLGAPDRTYEHASRAQQLEEAGLTGPGIAEKLRAWTAKETLSAK